MCAGNFDFMAFRQRNIANDFSSFLLCTPKKNDVQFTTKFRSKTVIMIDILQYKNEMNHK